MVWVWYTFIMVTVHSLKSEIEKYGWIWLISKFSVTTDPKILIFPRFDGYFALKHRNSLVLSSDIQKGRGVSRFPVVSRDLMVIFRWNTKFRFPGFIYYRWTQRSVNSIIFSDWSAEIPKNHEIFQILFLH